MKENLNREELSTAISDTRKSFDTDNPIVPFIEGDGIGIDIWPASQKVFDSAVKKAYNNQRKICLLYTSPSPRDKRQSRMPSSA